MLAVHGFLRLWNHGQRRKSHRDARGNGFFIFETQKLPAMRICMWWVHRPASVRKVATWSPGRFPISEKDEEFMSALMDSLANYSQWPDMGGGYYHPLSPYKMFLTCGNCQLICHPEKEERKRRYKMFKESGVVVQNEDGSLEAVSPEEGKQRMQNLPPDRRAFYEKV